MHLHAATTVDGRDRKRLERVCRYLLRPPFAHDAIEALEDGRTGRARRCRLWSRPLWRVFIDAFNRQTEHRRFSRTGRVGGG